MSSKQLVLLGAQGQLGKTLQQHWQDVALHEQWQVTAFGRDAVDISSPRSIAAGLAGIQADWVINAAAYTQVDKAEQEQNQAFGINGQGAGNIAEWVARQGGRLLQLSTDFVFSGSSKQAYMPEAETDPLSVYGASKLQGEQAVRRILGDRALVLRTSWLYSPYGTNFVRTMLRLMSEKDQLRVVSDQIGTPTATTSLAVLITRIIETAVGGIFHWSDAGVASWYEFAVAIQEEALDLGLLQRAVPITPISTAEYPTAARRPAFSVLDKTSTCQQFDCNPSHWRTQLRLVLQSLRTVH